MPVKLCLIVTAAALMICPDVLAETRVDPSSKPPVATESAVPAAPLPKTLPFQAALKESKSGNAVLLAVVIPSDADVKAKVNALLTEKSMQALGGGLIIGTVDAAASSGTEDASAFDEYRKKHKIRDTPVAFIAIDTETQKPLYTFLSVPTASMLSGRLKALIATNTVAYDGTWLENYADAAKLAAKLKRPMLLNFTGSDWCPYCIALEKEVFGTKEFNAYAMSSVVLVRLDFPRHAQPAALKQQNQQLAQKYGVKGYPTIIFTDAAGAKIGQTGYFKGGPGPWIENAKRFVQK